MLSNLLIFILVSYGISNIIVFSHGPFHLFDNMRDTMDKLPSNLGELTRCMICFPTWVGIFLSIINLVIIPEYYLTPFYNIIPNVDYWYVIIPLDAALSSGSVWLLHTIQETFESITEKNNGE